MRLNRQLVLCIGLFTLIGAACSKPPTTLDPVKPPELNSDAQAVVIDTDMGTDDAMAILYLLGRPNVDVKAIIVAGDGLAHCDTGVKNARGLTALGGRPEIPVACGHEKPLEGEHVYPDFMRSGADDLGKLGLPDNPEKST